MATTVIKDSGKRRDFSTGAHRDIQKGKGRFDLLSPIAMRRLALHYESGAEKYDERNWELGMPLKVFLDSALRHMFDYLEGMRDEDHLAAVLFNVSGLIHGEEMIKRGVWDEELGKLPSYVVEGTESGEITHQKESTE